MLQGLVIQDGDKRSCPSDMGPKCMNEHGSLNWLDCSLMSLLNVFWFMALNHQMCSNITGLEAKCC